jgi:hypothetical protein
MIEAISSHVDRECTVATQGDPPSSTVEHIQRRTGPVLFLHNYNYCLHHAMASFPPSTNPTGAASRPADTEFASDRPDSRTKSTVRNVRQVLIDFLKVLRQEGGTDVECRLRQSGRSLISYQLIYKGTEYVTQGYVLPHDHEAWNDIRTVFQPQVESSEVYKSTVDAVIKAPEAGGRKASEGIANLPSWGV